MPGFSEPPPTPSPAQDFKPEPPSYPSPEQPFMEQPPPPPSPDFTEARQSSESYTSSSPYQRPQPTGEYNNRQGFSLDPTILRWVPGGAMVLIFILSFFTWVQFTPLGVPYYSQNGWQAAFASVSKASDMTTLLAAPKKGENGETPRFGSSNPVEQALGGPEDIEKDLEPGVSVPTICYLLMLLLVLLPLCVGVPVLELLMDKIPQNLQPILNFRWTIATGLVLAVWFLLVLQLWLGFSLETNYQKFVNDKYEDGIATFDKMMENAPSDAKEKGAVARRSFDHLRGHILGFTEQTRVVWWVFGLHTLSVVLLAFLMWLDLRKKPDPPRVEFLW